jgi:hypothetical protein
MWDRLNAACSGAVIGNAHEIVGSADGVATRVGAIDLGRFGPRHAVTITFCASGTRKTLPRILAPDLGFRAATWRRFRRSKGSHSDGDGDSNCDRNAHGYSETYTNPEDRSHAKVPSHARTAPEIPESKPCAGFGSNADTNLKVGRRFASIAALIRTK